MALVDVSPGARSGWKARDAQKERFRTDRLSAHPRFVIRSLFSPVLGSGPDDGRSLCNACAPTHFAIAYHCHGDLPFQQSTLPHDRRRGAGSPEAAPKSSEILQSPLEFVRLRAVRLGR
jgi:hypothetical protein